MMERVVQASQYLRILKEFPAQMKFCFAYGSGALKQKTSDITQNMLDLVFVVRNPAKWHEENISRNPHHYAQPMRLLGHKAVAHVQETWGAKMYYNTLVKSAEGRTIKYGVVSEVSIIEDLLDWNVLYLAGRLHKPVEVLVKADDNSQLRTALLQNLHSAVHAALILLPEHFTESDFYKTIAGLSYNGDFRMTFGEDKNKVNNIVIPQLRNFRLLYAPVLKHFDKYLEIPKSEQAAIICHQDTSPAARIHHLNHLPRVPQVKLVRAWTQGPRSKDTEDCLRAVAHDPECSDTLQECLRQIVWKSSVSQSLKGIVTAGLVKSVLYSGAKIVKMFKAESKENKTVVAALSSGQSKMEKMEKSVPEKQENRKDGTKQIQK